MRKYIFSLVFLFLGITLMAGIIDLNNLYDYASQPVPPYITKNNTPPNNTITNEGATLGRVLFYDKNLSVNNSVSCGTCHQQQFAFSDTARLSVGLDGGLTGRHSMRLVNSKFGVEPKFFWNERAISLEDQTTKPIQDHVEMGFSGLNGNPDMDSLIRKLENVDYYERLFTLAFGTAEITEEKIQRALAQFIRSIQSFDSKYDIGRAMVNNDAVDFSNFTMQENMGKRLFLDPPPQGGAGCQGCHRAPEFDIDPNTQNNGVVRDAIDPNILDLNNTRSPSLRDLVNPQGILNGPLMHNGNFVSLMSVIDHYNAVPIVSGNTSLDPRLIGPNQQPQNLQLTQNQKGALVAFLRTLTGNEIYTADKWSNPFDAQNTLTLLPETTTNVQNDFEEKISIYPNPVSDKLYFELKGDDYLLHVYDINGILIKTNRIGSQHTEDFSYMPQGIYILSIIELNNRSISFKKIIKYQ